MAQSVVMQGGIRWHKVARGGPRWQEVAQGGTRRWYKVAPHSKALEDCKVEEGGTGHSEGESDTLRWRREKTPLFCKYKITKKRAGLSMVRLKGQRGKSESANWQKQNDCS